MDKDAVVVHMSDGQAIAFDANAIQVMADGSLMLMREEVGPEEHDLVSGQRRRKIQRTALRIIRRDLWDLVEQGDMSLKGLTLEVIK